MGVERQVKPISEKQARVMMMDSLPKLNRIFCINLELGIKIFSLVLIVLSMLPYWPPALILIFIPGFYGDDSGNDHGFAWIVLVPLLVNAITFALASFALQCLSWKKARVLLMPAAVVAPILSFVCLICIVPVFVSGMYGSIALGVILTLYFLLDSLLLAYYWVGLVSLYRNKNMPSDSSLLINEP